jgi:thioredoxin 2
MERYVVHCRACGAANRIPAENEGIEGRCGNCGATLTPIYLHPVTLSDASFDKFVERFTQPVLAEFWAPW